MKRSVVLSLVLVTGVFLAGCGSTARQNATTIAGVGVATSGPPPKPATPKACAHRWNAVTNADGRAAATTKAPEATAAFIRAAGTSGYFRGYAGRCLVYLILPPKSARVFVETEPGRFAFTADGMGHFAANAGLQPGGRLSLR